MSIPVSHIIVGVADLEPVRALWQRRFGLEAIAARQGSDAGLERLWGLPPGGVAGQLLLRTPGAASGALHFVQFSQPGEPVRAGAAATALCPKNIDVGCDDMPARIAELEADGYHFRSPMAEYEFAGKHVREVQMPAHDDINVVLAEVREWEANFSAQHYGGVTSFVTVIPDMVAESAFYSALFGLETLLQHRLTGPAIETMIGLPPGSAVDVRVLGAARTIFGRIELICYEGLGGDDLYPRARPPATGSLGARFEVADLDALLRRAEQHKVAASVSVPLPLLYGRCRVAQLSSPAGFRIEAFQLI